ncbi:tRNA (N6-isopentenyl adenosine(37)-C2)-methylthiotransferase MiaB [Verrucomicrobia bacterium LW23]|nr:tRNA (N6-isopentenyl adenosine(37)-C2)-methylthiotransferase MiaB [Verrucomicrobia bacterium LW23]
MPSVYIKTYGCQMNVRDSEQVSRQLQARGYTLAEGERDADVILINTCSVRDQAEQKAMNKMGALAQLKKAKPDLVLGFMGCMAQSRGADILDRLPDVDLIAGTQKFHEVANMVDRLRGVGSAPAATGAEVVAPDLASLPLPAAPADRRAPLVDIASEKGSQNTIREHVLAPKQVTAFVSIMQGCNMRCTFCIVPSTRGEERSRPIDDIVREVQWLAASGVKEVTLLGQIVNLYGRHEFPAVDGKSPFVQLLEAVCDVQGIERVRFTSPHPIGFRKDLVAAFGRLPKLCGHVHLPLQSGSNRLLRQMHRGYTAEAYLKLVAQLREANPDIALTTDIIVGFPGETEEDFAATVHVMREAQFDNSFIFRYSPRKDTPAATMDEQLPEDVKMDRNQRLLAVQDEIAKERNLRLVGQEVEVLVEGESKTNPFRYSGRTRCNKIVILEANERWRGQLLPVRIRETTGYTYYAEPSLTADTLDTTVA